MYHTSLFQLHGTASRRKGLARRVGPALVTWVAVSVSLLASLPAVSAQTSSCHLTGITCTPLSTAGTAPPTCFGASLRFSHTALRWANDSVSLADVTSRLKQWEGLSSVPECWAVVQPFICSVYMPKCDNDNGRVGYPSRELCERTREPCRLVTHFVHHWPDFLRCSQPYFKQNCGTGAYDQLSYNTTGRCDWPLVRTDQKDSWWAGLEGCGVQCQNPLYTDADHRHAHTFVALMATICLLSTLFTIFTFLIDWQNASKYPAIILFIINLCFLMATIGWMIQFSGDSRNDIVCRGDGTQRKQEPRSGERATCTVVFVLIYYFTMAALLWFVMLSYAWHVTFRALGTPRDDLSSKTAYFHLFSWSLPLVLTIVCLAISEIDGDSLSGICFVGYHNHSVRAGFVLVPVACVIIGGLFFLMRGLWTLVGIRKDAPEFVGDKATAKILETIFRIGIFSALALGFVIMTFVVHVYIFINESKWNSSLDDYLYCLANQTVSRAAGSSNTAPASCSIEHTPSLVAMEANMFAFFGAGIIMSSWSWTKASLYAWERVLRKVFNKPSHKPIRLERHRMIAQAYERRHDMNNGRMCVSYHSTHDDPLGMKFDLHSLSSNMSHLTNFAHNMPHLVQRRGGLVQTPAGALRRYSDSDIASVISRRYSQGSQQLHDHHGTGQLVYMERDNSSNNGSVTGGWRRRRRRRRKRRKKRNSIQPILGPVLSGMGFGFGSGSASGSKPGGGVLSGGVDGSARRGSESSILSKASAQGIRMHMESRDYRTGGGSTSSLTANDRIPAGGTASGSDLKGPHASRSRRRKLPRLAPLSRHRHHRSLSSSRSSLSQFGLGLHGVHHSAFAQHQAQFQQHQHQQQQQNPYAQLYAGYDYAQFYASMGYPQMAYPFWNPYFPYPPQFPPPPPPPHHQQQTGSHPSSPSSQLQPQPPGSTSSLPGTGDFSLFSGASTLQGGGGGGGGGSSSNEGESQRLVTASTSRRSEVTIETKQTELISLQKLKSGAPEYTKIPALPLSDEDDDDDDDSVEDLNSSQLEDSAEEEEGEELEHDDDDTTGDTTEAGEAEAAV